MIEMYTGTPGSGKSLHCAKTIYQKLTRGKNVIANFDINMSAFKPSKKFGHFVYIDNSDLTPEFLVDFALQNHKRSTSGHIVEGQTVVIIDECQIMFNCREWQANNRQRWATFFTQHRKFGYDIVLITQFDRLVDRQIRSLVEYEVKHRKASNYKTLGFLLGLPFKGNVFIAITCWYGVGEKTDSEFFVLRQKYARLYDSYKIFNTDAQLGLDDLKQQPPKAAPRAAPNQEQKPKTQRQPSTLHPAPVEVEQLPPKPQRWKPELVKVSDDEIPMPETAN